MTPAAREKALARLGACALALPEATETRSGPHATYAVRGKTFAYFLADHHGDGIVGVAMKAAPGENTLLALADPAHYYIPAYVGPRGWLGVRLDTRTVDWERVRAHVVESYRLVAPKRLAALL